MPEDFDYIVDFVGVPDYGPEKFKQINIMPAIVMKRLAKEYKARRWALLPAAFYDQLDQFKLDRLLKEDAVGTIDWAE